MNGEDKFRYFQNRCDIIIEDRALVLFLFGIGLTALKRFCLDFNFNFEWIKFLCDKTKRGRGYCL